MCYFWHRPELISPANCSAQNLIYTVERPQQSLETHLLIFLALQRASGTCFKTFFPRFLPLESYFFRLRNCKWATNSCRSVLSWFVGKKKTKPLAYFVLYLSLSEMVQTPLVADSSLNGDKDVFFNYLWAGAWTLRNFVFEFWNDKCAFVF